MYPNQQYAPPAQPAASTPAPTMGTIPGFAEPTMGTGGMPLKIREIEGRACVVYPVRHNAAKSGAMKFGVPESDSVTINVLVLDGPAPLQFGESRANDGTGGPPVYQVDTLPAMIEGVITNNSEIVKAVKGCLDAGRGDVIPCRVVRGTQGNRPFLLTQLGGELDPQAANHEQVRAFMMSVLTAIARKEFVNPVPREINGGPRKLQTTNAAAPAPAAQYPPQPAYAPPAGQVVYPPAQPAAAAVATAAPLPGWDPGAWLALTPEERAQAVAQQVPPIPPGWTADAWILRLTPPQRAQFMPTH